MIRKKGICRDKETSVSTAMEEDSKKKNFPHRISFFLLSSLSMFCFFFIYDSPAPMYPGLEKIFGETYRSYHSLLYSAYALPNLFLPLIVSTLSVSSGSRTMGYTYSLIVVGQILVLLGGVTHSFESMVFGRFVIGLGGECFSVAQNKMLSSLFQNGEHGRVFSMSIAIARMGSILAYVLLGHVIQFGVVLCLSIGTGIIFIGGALMVFLVNAEDISHTEAQEEKEKRENHHLLPYILLIAFLIACAIAPFAGSSSIILQTRLKISYESASRMLAIQEGVSLVSTVIVSILTDKYGHRLSSICIGTFLLTVSHVLILSSTPLSYLPASLLGISSGMIACCWPCIPLLICPTRLTTGLSILSCGINLAYTVCPPILSRITDREFIISQQYTICICASASFIALCVYVINRRKGYGLNGRAHIKIYGEEEAVRDGNSSHPQKGYGGKLYQEEKYNGGDQLAEAVPTGA